MTIHVSSETVRQLVEKHVRNLYPGQLFGEIHVMRQSGMFSGYMVEIIDQSPFDLPPEKVKAGFDRARDAVRKAAELDAGEGVR